MRRVPRRHIAALLIAATAFAQSPPGHAQSSRRVVITVVSNTGDPVVGAVVDIKAPGLINDTCNTAPEGTCAFELPAVDAEYLVRLHSAIPGGFSLPPGTSTDQRVTVTSDGDTPVRYVVTKALQTTTITTTPLPEPTKPSSSSSNATPWLLIALVFAVVAVVVAALMRRERAKRKRKAGV